jgi:hypothetical protein
MSEDAKPFEPISADEMSEEMLRAEAWFWRQNVAAMLGEALVGIDRDPLRRLRDLTTMLEAALTGDLHPTCFICAEPLLVGQATLREAEEGEVHAACLGDPLDGDGPIKPGDKVQCDPEGFVDAEGEPIADHDGIVEAGVYERLYTTRQLAEKVAKGQAFLADDKARADAEEAAAEAEAQGARADA